MSGGWLGARAALVAVGVVVAMVFGVSGASAATLTVCESGPPTCGFAHIQEAINAASTGDRVEVAAGTYDEHLSVPGAGTATSLRLQGAGAGTTTIDGTSSGTPLTIGFGVSVTVKGVTITNGGAPTRFGAPGIANDGGRVTLRKSVVSKNVGFGGGILNEGEGLDNGPNGRVTLVESTVSGNHGDEGGGILNENNATLTLKHSTVSGNIGGDGGGGIWSNSGAVTLTHSTVSGNEGVLEGGGGILASEGQLTLTYSTVSGNTTPHKGGGIYNNYLTTMTLSHSTISGNIASGNPGGGIFNNATAILSNSKINNNSAGSGGGIWTEAGEMTITNSRLTGNHAQNGGAIKETGGSLTLSGSTVSSNEALREGGGLDAYTVELINTRIIKNTAEEGGGIYNRELVKGSGDTITGNTALVDPGIFSLPGAMVTLTGSTVQP